MISLTKANSFVFLSEVTTDATLGVREQFISKDMINEKI